VFFLKFLKAAVEKLVRSGSVAIETRSNLAPKVVHAASIRAAQTVVYFFSTFLEFRPVSTTHDVYTSINSRLEIRISKSKTPV
jgi:hypothetical protein